MKETASMLCFPVAATQSIKQEIRRKKLRLIVLNLETGIELLLSIYCLCIHWLLCTHTWLNCIWSTQEMIVTII